jgi:hypothetical protein
MPRRASRGVLIVALCATLASVSPAPALAAAARTCVSHAGSPDFARAGKPPGKNRGLTFCAEYERNTCCDRGATDAVRRIVAHMQASGFSPTCRDAWSALECSICDPNAGVEPKTTVCASTCDHVYRACENEYFAEDALHRLTPCRAADTICTKLSDWMAETGGGGAEMCEAAGYEVLARGPAEEKWCFDGAAPGLRQAPGAEDGGGARDAGKKKKKKKTDTASAGKAAHRSSSSEEFAGTWTAKALAVAGAAAAAAYGFAARRRRARWGDAGAARHAARVAAEKRSMRAAAFESNAKML